MKTIFRLAVIIFGFLFVVSCELESSNNGDLDGYWQMHTVDTLKNNISADTRSDGIFWAVQMHLLEMIDSKNITPRVFFRFKNKGDSILLSDPYINQRDSGDIKLTNSDVLRAYGLTSLRFTLKIVKLSSSEMVLQTDSLRMHFRKY